MEIRRTIKERDIIKAWIFGNERDLIGVITDSGYDSISSVLSRCRFSVPGGKEIHHINVLNQDRSWIGAYLSSGKKID